MRRYVTTWFSAKCPQQTRVRLSAAALFAWLATVTLVIVSPALAQTPIEKTEKQPDPGIQIPPDATVESLFVDFLHYARLGRFALADAYARALLAHPDLDPVVVMRAAQRDKKSVDTLLVIIKNSSIGENAVKVLDLIHEGENLRREDREQIRSHISKLSGNPQQEAFAIRALAEAGEYAIAPMVQVLLDPGKRDLWPRVTQALMQMGKTAVSPLVMALNVRNDDVRVNLIRALGEIGYPQAVPYLGKLVADPKMPEVTKSAAATAIERIISISGRSMSGSPTEWFLRLGEACYNEDDAVRADPRLENANVWYWDDAEEVLRAVPVPVRIHGPIMAMRAAEEALHLRPDHAESLALWLAADIRRESRLGMNIESGDPAVEGNLDPTRPKPFPRALYFTQTAGPGYAHLVLRRAVKDNDSAVALGAIEALRLTAGDSSLVGTEDYKQPLVQALRFPDQVVRLRAALALGAALPKSPFADSQLVVPLLTMAVNLTGTEQFVIVDSRPDNLNRVTDALRAGGRNVIGDTNFYRAMDRLRAGFPVVAAFFIATDVAEPELNEVLGQVRREFLFSRTPIVLLVRTGGARAAEAIARRDRQIETIDADAPEATLLAAADRVRARTGQAPLKQDAARAFSLQAVETLRRIAVDGRTVYELGVAEPALVAALSSPDEQLQTTAAAVLAVLRTPSAQRAIAELALDAGNAVSLRLSAFASLSESAKNSGNHLEDGQITELVRITREEKDLIIRTAAAQALGALNLAGNKASDFIRSYYRG